MYQQGEQLTRLVKQVLVNQRRIISYIVPEGEQTLNDYDELPDLPLKTEDDYDEFEVYLGLKQQKREVVSPVFVFLFCQTALFGVILFLLLHFISVLRWNLWLLCTSLAKTRPNLLAKSCHKFFPIVWPNASHGRALKEPRFHFAQANVIMLWDVSQTFYQHLSTFHLLACIESFFLFCYSGCSETISFIGSDKGRSESATLV